MNNISTSSHIHFSLASSLYATTYDNAIIILDALADKYLSIIDEAALFLKLILEHAFIQNNNGMYSITNKEQKDKEDLYNYWISYFAEKKFIIPATHPTILTTALQPGGLKEYRWDFKKSWKPFKESSFFNTLTALYMLAKVHRTIKRKGILGIIQLIEKYTTQKKLYNPTSQEIEKLSASVDAASLLYPQKTVCLPWAATYVALALQKKWNIHFVIGVQTKPFYAHAWAETSDGTVINDDPLIAQALSIIFKTPKHYKD